MFDLYGRGSETGGYSGSDTGTQSKPRPVRASPHGLAVKIATTGLDLPPRVETAAELAPSCRRALVVSAESGSACRKMDEPESAALIGDGAAAAIVMGLAQLHASGRLRRGQTVLLLGTGAGFGVGGAILRW
jgi:hypothetical protein